MSVSATGPSTRTASTLAARAGAALRAAGLKVAPSTTGATAKTRRLRITFTL